MQKVILKLKLTSIATLLSIALFAQNPISIVGHWQSSSFELSIYQQADGTYSGKILKDEAHTENVNKVLLYDLHYDKSSKSYKGSMQPSADMEMKLDVELTLEGKNEIVVKVGKFFISKTMKLNRKNQSK